MTNEHCSQSGGIRNFAFGENERRMRQVVVLTAVMMMIEIIGGTWLGSMALLADGFHMATHVAALGISAFAYAYARRHASDARYSFGTGKVGDLGGFTSAILLLLVAIYVIYESGARLVAPVSIAYAEAIIIAFVGLAVNVASAVILNGAHDKAGHGHHHDHAHDHDHHHGHKHDNNFRSAYVHVIADAVTSVLALVALFCGWSLGWRWMDPVMGMIGAGVIISWAWTLLRDTSAILLDQTPKNETAEKIRGILAQKGAQITDMHLWRVGPDCYAAILAITGGHDTSPDSVREWLKPLALAHVTVEIRH